MCVSRLGLAIGRFGTFPGGPLPFVGCCLRWAVYFHGAGTASATASAAANTRCESPAVTVHYRSPGPRFDSGLRSKKCIKKINNNNDNLPFIASIRDPPITSLRPTSGVRPTLSETLIQSNRQRISTLETGLKQSGFMGC